MTSDEMIRAAQEALGEDRADDYRIQPTQHAQGLATKAPALAAVLGRSELKVLAEQYEKKDRQANEHQALFKSTASRANWAVFLTACFSTLLLIVAPLKLGPGVPTNVVLALLGVCGVIAGALGAMWVYRTREGKLLDNWMGSRAAAEALRAQYFQTATSLELADTNSPIAPALLQFEYFRRYDLDVEVAFYEKRGADHQREAEQMLRISAFSVALASISAGLAAVLGSLNTAWVSIAALGTVATALSSFAATRESVGQSRRNAERYANTSDALAMLKGKLDAVRTAAAAGEREPVKQFVAAAHEQISAEHKQWLAAEQAIQPAIDKLDDTLSKLKPKSKGSEPAAEKPAEEAKP